VLFEQASARGLSAMEGVDRSCRRKRSGALGLRLIVTAHKVGI
jgi:hypothetical protein